MKLSAIPALAAFLIPALAVPTPIATTPSTSLPTITTAATATTRDEGIPGCFDCNGEMASGINALTSWTAQIRKTLKHPLTMYSYSLDNNIDMDATSTTTAPKTLVTRAMPHRVITRLPIPPAAPGSEAHLRHLPNPWTRLQPTVDTIARNHLEENITKARELTTEGKPVLAPKSDTDAIEVLHHLPSLTLAAFAEDYPSPSSSASQTPQPTFTSRSRSKDSPCELHDELGGWELYPGPEQLSSYKKCLATYTNTKPTPIPLPITHVAPKILTRIMHAHQPSHAIPSYTNITTATLTSTIRPTITPTANCTTTIKTFPTLNMGPSTTYSSTTTSTRLVTCSGCALKVHEVRMGHGPGPVVLGGKSVVKGTGVKTEVVPACRPTEAWGIEWEE